MDTLVAGEVEAASLPEGEVICGGLDVLDAIAAEWSALCEEGPCDEPFYRPEWIRAYVQAFARDATLAIATARRGGRLIGVLPLVREFGWLAGIPARKLRSAGNFHTCRFDLVHGASGADAAVSAIWRALDALPGWDVLELISVPRGGAAGALARFAKAQGSRVRVKRAPSSPYVRLAPTPDAFDWVLQRLDGKFRANLRRRMRKLQAKAPVEIRRSDAVDGQLARFYALEREGWKGRDGTAIACSPQTRAFYDEVAKEAARHGYLSLYSLECGGEPVAMHYGLMRKGRYFILKTAYDESLRDCSPGQLITHEVFRDLASRGCSELDFLGIWMDWKQDWAPRPRPHANWFVLRGPAARLLETMRFDLLPPVVDLLRRSRPGNGAGRPAWT